ncbi:hypothetical protein OUZ56_001308 [Daphnia magna]|uniref:Uncharacterized protein n=1 Tax=Daphnia magna TaxID=35525 RepID=A0ABR0A288_9CRUS|nr:hypothetical protein OUZ56_001308 [Daphnia magna]
MQQVMYFDVTTHRHTSIAQQVSRDWTATAVVDSESVFHRVGTSILKIVCPTTFLFESRDLKKRRVK